MAINFPATPTLNQTYTYNGRTWTYNNVGWQATGSTGLTVYTKTNFTATAAQTTFSVTYTVGFVDVYYNGSKLSSSEYTATTGSTVVLGTACALNDIVETIAWTISSSFNPSLGSASATSLAIGGATIGSNALAVTGTTALSGLLTAAGGVSSTLTTDASSSTTGSIITAGGISTQKALWVGTTSRFVGAVSSNAGITNTVTGQIHNDIQQNSLTSFQVTNSNAGAAAQASYRLYNGNTIADLSVFGTAFTTDGVRVANGVALDARPGGAATLALLGTTIRFAVNTTTTEVARFGTSGGLLIGTTTENAKLAIVGSTSSQGIFVNSSASGDDAIYAQNGGGLVGSCITCNVGGPTTYLQVFKFQGSAVGTITTNGTTTAYNTTSDYRLKENVQLMTGGLDTIAALKPVTYDWISNGSAGEGFIAHELQAVIPEAVYGEKDAVNDKGEIKPQGVDFGKIVPHLVAAIQELTTRLAALENKT